MSSFQNSFSSQFYTRNGQQQPCFGISIPEKQFKRSQNADPHFAVTNKQKINLKQFQFQQKIALLKVQLKIQSIFNILQPKVCNIKRNVLSNLKNTINPEQISHMQQSIAVDTMTEVFTKIGDFIQRQRTKLLSKGLSNIIVRGLLMTQLEINQSRGKKKLSEKRDSSIRGHSKLDNSLHVSDLEGDGSSYTTSNGHKVKNKELKKQKQKFEKGFNDFYSQMDQILSVHEQYLKKK